MNEVGQQVARAQESEVGCMTERGALELVEADEQDRFRLLRLYQDSV